VFFLFSQYGDDCIKIEVDALYHMIGSKAVDGRERQSLASTNPHIANIVFKCVRYATTGINAIDIGKNN
jgi:hypothetical protein